MIAIKSNRKLEWKGAKINSTNRNEKPEWQVKLFDQIVWASLSLSLYVCVCVTAILYTDTYTDIISMIHFGLS